MTGTPQYDEATVIEAAMRVFWRHGYAAASISDLTEATGLSRSSIYQRFRDKSGLFQHALTFYTERVLHRMGAVQENTGRRRLEALLRDYVVKETAPRCPAGCMLVRSCVEKADLPPAAQSIALAGVDQQHEIIANILRSAITDGDLPPEAQVDTLAWYYLSVLHALTNLPQAGVTAETMGHVIDIAMSVWPTTPDSGV